MSTTTCPRCDSALHEHDRYLCARCLAEIRQIKADSQTHRTKPARASISPRRRYAILQRDEFRCGTCGRSAARDGVTLHVDHQQPLSKGGSNDDENLWTLCSDCNVGKGASLS